MMAESCLLYYITDRTAFLGDEPVRRRRLLEKIAEAARAGVDYIQLREKDLSTRDLESLAREAVCLMAQLRTENRELRTALLINSRADVALAVGADGVHLRGDDISPKEVRHVWEHSEISPTLRKPREVGQPIQRSVEVPLIGVSCHSPAEVAHAAANGATFAVFAPIFGKKDTPSTPPTGLAMLEKAGRAKIPVLALGGITLANAQSCLKAGAAGIAGIRLFQENDVAEVVRQFETPLTESL